MLFNGHHTHLVGDIVDVEAVGTLGTLDVVATANAYSCEVIAADRPCSTPVGAPVVVGAELELNIVVSEGVLNIPVVRSHLNHVDIGRPVICPVTNEGDHVILCRLLILQLRPRVAHVVLVEREGVVFSRHLLDIGEQLVHPQQTNQAERQPYRTTTQELEAAHKKW